MVLFEKKITKNVIKRLALFSKHIPRSEVYSIMKHMKFMLHRIMQMISNNDKSRYFGKENLSQVINGGFAFT